MSANRVALGPPASNLRLARSSGDSRLEARFSPEGRLAHARVRRGDYGNGDERKRRLGSHYLIAQTRVNKMPS